MTTPTHSPTNNHHAFNLSLLVQKSWKMFQDLLKGKKALYLLISIKNQTFWPLLIYRKNNGSKKLTPRSIRSNKCLTQRSCKKYQLIWRYQWVNTEQLSYFWIRFIKTSVQSLSIMIIQKLVMEKILKPMIVFDPSDFKRLKNSIKWGFQLVQIHQAFSEMFWNWFQINSKTIWKHFRKSKSSSKRFGLVLESFWKQFGNIKSKSWSISFIKDRWFWWLRRVK